MLSTFLRYKEKRAEDCLETSTLSITSLELKSVVEVGMLEQPRTGDFCAICHDGTEKLLSAPGELQADFLGLRAIGRCQLDS